MKNKKLISIPSCSSNPFLHRLPTNHPCRCRSLSSGLHPFLYNPMMSQMWVMKPSNVPNLGFAPTIILNQESPRSFTSKNPIKDTLKKSTHINIMNW